VAGDDVDRFFAESAPDVADVIDDVLAPEAVDRYVG
jgi:hypothetical protein